MWVAKPLQKLDFTLEIGGLHCLSLGRPSLRLKPLDRNIRLPPLCPEHNPECTVADDAANLELFHRQLILGGQLCLEVKVSERLSGLRPLLRVGVKHPAQQARCVTSHMRGLPWALEWVGHILILQLLHEVRQKFLRRIESHHPRPLLPELLDPVLPKMLQLFHRWHCICPTWEIRQKQSRIQAHHSRVDGLTENTLSSARALIIVVATAFTAAEVKYMAFATCVHVKYHKRNSENI